MKIFDTSSIVCIFREVKYPKILDVCKCLGYRLSITSQVYEEITKNPQTLRHLEAYGDVEIIQDGDAECCKKLAKRYPWLHKGELSVLCAGVAKKQDNQRYYCVIDERARNLRENLKIRVTGTVGLILWEKEVLALTGGECRDLYSRFLQSSFRINKEILQGLLK
jgi:predicted nucleic acid-binding protein